MSEFQIGDRVVYKYSYSSIRCGERATVVGFWNKDPIVIFDNPKINETEPRLFNAHACGVSGYPDNAYPFVPEAFELVTAAHACMADERDYYEAVSQ